MTSPYMLDGYHAPLRYDLPNVVAPSDTDGNVDVPEIARSLDTVLRDAGDLSIGASGIGVIEVEILEF